MGNGSYKNIEDIEVGDFVTVFNVETEEFEEAKVKRLYSRMFDNIHEIYLENGEILRVSANQPIWTKSKGWADIEGFDRQKLGANQLEIGDIAYGRTENGELEEAKIVDIVPIEGDFFTYDFVDMKYNTFIADDVVVHNSFPPGTQVNMIDGSYKNIEDVQIGDVVFSWDFYQQKPVIAPVTSTWSGLHEDMYIINDDIHVSSNHPFWTKEYGWAAIDTVKALELDGIDAAELEVGLHIRDATNNFTEVKSIEPNFGNMTTYNIIVGNTHNYYAEDLLVHNKCFMPGTKINLANGSYKNIEDVQIGDLVKVFNEKTNQFENASVNHIQTQMHDDVYELYLENGKVLMPTSNHPFLSKEKGWATISGLDEMGMGSGTLEIGDTLYQLESEGKLKEIKIVDILPLEGSYLTYNLIDMEHGTFLADDIVTHNSCFLPGTPVNLANGSYKNIEDTKIGDFVKVFNEETKHVDGRL